LSASKWKPERSKKGKKEQKGKKVLFALFAPSCLFCFLAVFFTASLNQQKCPDIRASVTNLWDEAAAARLQAGIFVITMDHTTNKESI
jgi:hypothetical protein